LHSIRESPIMRRGGRSVIASFDDHVTEALYHGRPSRERRRFPADVVRVALRGLDLLNAARTLGDLRAPRGSRVEALRGDLAGRHSIRVNDQWWIVFRWAGYDAHDVRMTDDHRARAEGTRP
jgi:proteic killer suppression protein